MQVWQKNRDGSLHKLLGDVHTAIVRNFERYYHANFLAFPSFCTTAPTFERTSAKILKILTPPNKAQKRCDLISKDFTKEDSGKQITIISNLFSIHSFEVISLFSLILVFISIETIPIDFKSLIFHSETKPMFESFNLWSLWQRTILVALGSKRGVIWIITLRFQNDEKSYPHLLSCFMKWVLTSFCFLLVYHSCFVLSLGFIWSGFCSHGKKMWNNFCFQELCLGEVVWQPINNFTKVTNEVFSYQFRYKGGYFKLMHYLVIQLYWIIG